MFRRMLFLKFSCMYMYAYLSNEKERKGKVPKGDRRCEKGNRRTDEDERAFSVKVGIGQQGIKEIGGPSARECNVGIMTIVGLAS